MRKEQREKRLENTQIQKCPTPSKVKFPMPGAKIIFLALSNRLKTLS